MAPVNAPEGGTMADVLSRTGDTSQPLTVGYDIGGTATPGDRGTPGADYQTLPGSITFAAGKDTAVVEIPTFLDAGYDPDETVTLTIYPTAEYTLVGGAGSDMAVMVTTEALLAAPTPAADDAATAEDTPLTLDSLTYNDTDPVGASLAIVGVTDGAHGTVALAADGLTVTYTPAANWSGTDTFNYTVSNGAATATAAVSVTVNPVNDPPAAADITANTTEDTPVAVTLSGTDAEGSPVSFVIDTGPADGTLGEIDGAGVTYYPGGNFAGTDTFTYRAFDGEEYGDPATVTITVADVADGPGVTITPAAGAAEVQEQGLFLDPDDDGGTDDTVVLNTAPAADVTIALAVGPELQVSPAVLTFTSADWNTPQTVRITAPDDNTVQADTHTATVTHTVASADPVYDGIAAPDLPVTIDEGDLAGIFVDPGDTPTDLDEGTQSSAGYAVSLFSQPAADVTVTLTPDSQVTLSAATLVFTPADWDTPQTVTVTAVNDASPEGYRASTIGLSAASTDPTYGGMTDSFAAMIVDDDAPNAYDDEAATDEDTAATINVLSNDTDPQSATLAVSSYTQPANGTVVLNPDGTFTYTPAANWSGADVPASDPPPLSDDSFTYVATSDTGVSNVATVYLTVNPVDDPPVVTNPGPQSLNEDDAVSLQIAVTDVDSSSFIYTVTSLPPGLTIDPLTGLIWGWVGSQAAGSYTSTVTVKDMEGAAASVTFGWTVGDTNHAPSFDPIPASYYTVGYSTTASPLAHDIDNDTLSYTVSGLPPGLAYDPGTNQISGTFTAAGTYTVTYTASDGHGGSDSVSSVWYVLGSTETATRASFDYMDHKNQMAFVDPATAFTFTVRLGGQFTWGQEYAVHLDVTPAGRSDLDITDFTLSNANSMTVTLTARSVSQRVGDVHVRAWVNGRVGDDLFLTNIGVVMPKVIDGETGSAGAGYSVAGPADPADVKMPNIDAATTPPSMKKAKIARISLGQDQPGSFAGEVTVAPAGAVDMVSFGINKPILDIKYGDIGFGPVTKQKDGKLVLKVYGINPTLPSTGADGKDDYKASYRDGVGVKVTLKNPGVAVGGPKSNMFSVATIPIATKVSKIDEADGYRVDPVGHPNDYLFGALATIDFVYDGETTSNSNFVGEFVYHSDYGGPLVTTGTTNDQLYNLTSLLDPNGIPVPAPTLADARIALATGAKVGLNASTLVSTWYQKFNFINTAVDPLNSGATRTDANTLKNVDPAIRHAVKESYYEFRMYNVKVRIPTRYSVDIKRYLVHIIRSAVNPPIKELAGDDLTTGLMPVGGHKINDYWPK